MSEPQGPAISARRRRAFVALTVVLVAVAVELLSGLALVLLGRWKGMLYNPTELALSEKTRERLVATWKRSSQSSHSAASHASMAAVID